MKNEDRRFTFGLVITTIWLAIALATVVVGERPTKINEWGDFFAGYFAPLAFLWLVLGYLQQGEELRQSSEALRLQAEELKNSVEQQSQLVEVSRKQLEQALEEHNEQRLQTMRAQLPRFIISPKVVEQGPNEYTYDLIVENVGQLARDVLLRMDQAHGPTDMFRLPLMRPGDKTSTRFKIKKDTTIRGDIKCLDEHGAARETTFEITWDHRGHVSTQPAPLL